jgi:hypothetical protein
VEKYRLLQQIIETVDTIKMKLDAGNFEDIYECLDTIADLADLEITTRDREQFSGQ